MDSLKYTRTLAVTDLKCIIRSITVFHLSLQTGDIVWTERFQVWYLAEVVMCTTELKPQAVNFKILLTQTKMNFRKM
jgi:hypothetical protein